MESYIQKVLRELELPAEAKADVAEELRQRAQEAQCDSAGLCLEKIGPAEKVSLFYYEKYKRALGLRNRKLYSLTLLLFLAAMFFAFLALRQFYHYGKERIQFAQAKFFFSQLNPSDNAMPADGAKVNAGQTSEHNDKKPLGFPKEPEANFSVTLDLVIIVCYLLLAFFFLFGVKLCFEQKKEWSQSTFRLPAATAGQKAKKQHN